MAKELRNDVKKWKKTFPWYKRLAYTIVGYPPKPLGLPEDVWKKWDSRFDSPEYDWKKHSGFDRGKRP